MQVQLISGTKQYKRVPTLFHAHQRICDYICIAVMRLKERQRERENILRVTRKKAIASNRKMSNLT